MTVYVDWLMNHGWVMRGRRIQSCHMMADSEYELEVFALKIGLKSEWMQWKGALHYDLTPSKRRAAVEAGAEELDRKSFRPVYHSAIKQGRERRNPV